MRLPRPKGLAMTYSFLLYVFNINVYPFVMLNLIQYPYDAETKKWILDQVQHDSGEGGMTAKIYYLSTPYMRKVIFVGEQGVNLITIFLKKIKELL